MKKFLLGCAIVSAIVVVAIVVSSLAFVSWFKKGMPDQDHLKEVRTELISSYGERDDYTPPLDGSIDPARVALFLDIREDMILDRVELSSELDEFLQDIQDWEGRDLNFFQKATKSVQMATGGTKLVRSGMALIGLRSEKLLEAGMGEGEYFHYFVLMAFSWKEWDPLDELEPVMIDDLDLERDVEEMVDEYRRIFERQLRNQRNELQALDTLDAEQERALEQVKLGLSGDSGRFPFQGQVPKQWLEVFEPYEFRFVDTLPRSPAEMLLDAISLLDDSSSDGIEINFDDPR